MSIQTKSDTKVSAPEKIFKPAEQSSTRWPSYANPLALLGLLVGVAILNPWGIISPSSILPATPLESSFQHKPQETIAPFNLADKYRDSCPDHQFKSVRLVSRSPEIILIDGFITEDEADALVKMA